MLSPEDIERRRSSKRYNESVKLVASGLNALSVATIGASFLLPAVGGAFRLTALFGFWLLLAIGLHILGHVALRRLRSED